MNIKHLSDLLHFFSVEELQTTCKKYGLPIQVPAPLLKKPSLIQAIILYVETGKKIQFKNSLPTISRASTKTIELAPQAKILFGAYKNDLQTRIFMKKLIGEHFHFTAFGHDWIKEKWMQGDPPTYQEFTDFWQKEYLYRKKYKNTPLKQEWAYLNFLKDYKLSHPEAIKQETLQAWEETQKNNVKEAYRILTSIRQK